MTADGKYLLALSAGTINVFAFSETGPSLVPVSQSQNTVGTNDPQLVLSHDNKLVYAAKVSREA